MRYELENARTLQIVDEPNVTSSTRVQRIVDPLLGSGSFYLAAVRAAAETALIANSAVKRLKSTEIQE